MLLLINVIQLYLVSLAFEKAFGENCKDFSSIMEIIYFQTFHSLTDILIRLISLTKFQCQKFHKRGKAEIKEKNSSKTLFKFVLIKFQHIPFNIGRLY